MHRARRIGHVHGPGPGGVHTDALCDKLGIDPDRVPRTFPTRGNIGPVSVPFTLAGEVDDLTSGDRVLLMGIGSGLNASCVEIVW